MFLILGALRRITTPFLAIRNGTWRGGPAFTLGRDPRGKTLGILGMGGIGRALAHRARAFGMHIQYHNRHRLPTSREHGAVYVPFDTLLRTSDVLSLNLALNASTRHIVGAAELARMPDGAVLVNTARGPVVDEAALVDALRRGKLAAVGLDVFEHEPHVHPGLLEHPHAVLLPHVGTATVETQKAMEVLVLDNLRSAVEGKGLLTQIPEQKPRGPSM
jgi:lactate dehydrogenase-like 2-hydroxyacid dehydrogenase